MPPTAYIEKIIILSNKKEDISFYFTDNYKH